MATYIASSREANDIAERIREHLSSDDHAVIGWWEKAAFPHGLYQLTRLLELSTLCDSVVFVFRLGDQTWPCHAYAEGPDADVPHVTRDNVILEYGAFLARCGRERIFIVTDPESAAALPHAMQASALAIDDAETPETISRRLRQFERSTELATREISIFTHKHGDAPRPPASSAKIAYRGMRGAEAWAELEQDPTYARSRAKNHVTDFLRTDEVSTQLRKCRHIISFGPGIGRNDCEAIAALDFGHIVDYIPVDINYYLAVFSAHHVDQMNLAISSRGIVADFESDSRFITDVVRRYAIGPKLFMMLGGTFGNIERSELAFFRNLSSMMDKNDYFLLDSFFARADYSVNDDWLGDPQVYTVKMREFLANGVAQRLGMSWADAINEFESLIQVIPLSDLDNSATSGRLLIVTKDKQETIMSVKRHDRQRIREIAEHNHLCLEAESSTDISPGIERSVLVFQRESSAAPTGRVSESNQRPKSKRPAEDGGIQARIKGAT